jgi:hypothetical protein
MNCCDCPAVKLALEGETPTPVGRLEKVILTLESKPLDPVTLTVTDPGFVAEIYRPELDRDRSKLGGN